MPTAPIAVAGYRLSLNADKNKGQIVVKLKNGKEQEIEVENAAEFAALAAVLKEPSVFYYPDSGTLTTG
jgi:hypothetical protein